MPPFELSNGVDMRPTWFMCLYGVYLSAAVALVVPVAAATASSGTARTPASTERGEIDPGSTRCVVILHQDFGGNLAEEEIRRRLAPLYRYLPDLVDDGSAQGMLMMSSSEGRITFAMRNACREAEAQVRAAVDEYRHRLTPEQARLAPQLRIEARTPTQRELRCSIEPLMLCPYLAKPWPKGQEMQCTVTVGLRWRQFSDSRFGEIGKQAGWNRLFAIVQALLADQWRDRSNPKPLMPIMDVQFDQSELRLMMRRPCPEAEALAKQLLNDYRRRLTPFDAAQAPQLVMSSRRPTRAEISAVPNPELQD